MKLLVSFDEVQIVKIPKEQINLQVGLLRKLWQTFPGDYVFIVTTGIVAFTLILFEYYLVIMIQCKFYSLLRKNKIK